MSNFKRVCSSDFPLLYIHKNFLKNLWKQKILYLKQSKWFFKKSMENHSSDSYKKSHFKAYLLS